MLSLAQFEALREYLDDDAQMHIKANGKWRLDAGKLRTALGVAGIGIEVEKPPVEADQYIAMRFITVHYHDGDKVHTNINGTRAAVEKYYVGNWFNVGNGPDDNMKRAVRVEFH